MTLIDDCRDRDYNSHDGRISIAVHSTSSFTTSWSGPSGYTSTQLSLSAIDAGRYHLMVTSNDDPNCSEEMFFNVQACTMSYDDPNDDPCISISHANTNPISIRLIQNMPSLSGQATASLLVSVPGATLGTYSYYWTNENDEIFTSRQLTNIPSGTYTFFVDNGCGEVISEEFTVGCLADIDITLEYDQDDFCSGEAHIAAIVDGEENLLDFDYSWNGESSDQPNVIIADAGIEYCVTVTDKQSNCKKTECITLEFPDYFIQKSDGGCPLENDGKLVLSITNPNIDVIELTVNGALREVPNFQDRFIYTINNLTGEELTIKMKIGECDFPEIVEILKFEEFEEVFEEFDKEVGRCIYNQYCNGNKLPEIYNNYYFPDYDYESLLDIPWLTDFEATLSNILPSILDIFGLGRLSPRDKFPCATPILCNGMEVGAEIYEGVEMRAGVYKVLMQISEHPQWWKQHNLDKVTGNNCGRVWVCTSTMQVLGTGPGTPGFPYAQRFDTPILDENGCMRDDCSRWFAKTTCIDDIIEDYGLTGLTPGCGQVFSGYVAPVIEHLEAQLHSSDRPEKLQEFISKWKGDPAANCGTVLYCMPDFKVLYTDIEEVDCEILSHPISLYEEDWLYGDWAGCGIVETQNCSQICDSEKYACSVQCKEYDTGNGGKGYICQAGSVVVHRQPGSNFKASDEEQYETKNVSFFSEPSTFDKFNYLHENDHAVPNILYEFEGERFNQAFSHDFENLLISEANQLEWYIVDRSSNISYYLINENLEDQNIKKLIIDKEDERSIIEITHSEGFNILKFEKELNSNLYISGSYKQEFQIGEVTISGSEELSYFEFLIDPLGNIIENNHIEDIKFVIVSNSGDSGAFAIQKQNELSTFYEVGSYTNNYQAFVSIGSDIKIKALTYDKDEETVSYVLAGNGSFVIVPSFDSTQPIPINPTSPTLNEFGENIIELENDIALVSTDLEGNILGKTIISSSKINLNSISIAGADLSDQLIVGFDFTANIILEGTSYTSRGKEDLIFLEVLKSGEVEDVIHIGSSGKETIEEMYISNNAVYFGGIVAYPPAELKLGRVVFNRVFPQISDQAYLSYFMIDDENEVVETELRQSKSKSTLATTTKVKLVPNPFNSTFTIEMNAPIHMGDAQLQIVNSFGSLVSDQSILVKKGINQFEINHLNHSPNGVFSVVISSKKTNYLYTDRIIKIR